MITAIIIAAGTVLFVLCACKLAGDADRRRERMKKGGGK